MTDARPEPDETEDDTVRTADGPTMAGTADAGSEAVVTGSSSPEAAGTTDSGTNSDQAETATGPVASSAAETVRSEPAAEPARPEPVWARPATPDAWGRPTEEDRPASPEGAPEATTGPVTADRPAVDQPAPVGVTQPVPAAPEPAEIPATYAQPLQPQTPVGAEEWQQQAPASNPPAPPQYPQYTAPAGLGSPSGPDPVETIGTAPTAAAETGPTAPWYVDASRPGPFAPTDQPDQPAPAFGSDQPAPAFGNPGWPSSEPYAAGGSGGQKKRRAAGAVLLVGVCLLTGAIGGVAGSALRDGATDSSGRNPTISLPAPAPVNANQGTSPVTAVAAAVLPSVVSINVKTADGAGTGSGFVINAANGYILTNNHVVTAGGSSPATSIEVVFQDGTQVPGKVVGLDGSYDLAVVKVTAKGLRELDLGDSDAVRVGDPVVAIGAPLGLQGTVTTGIVSALNRPVAAGEGNKPAFINAIQTDAAINPGNSGGPLVNSAGQVIAVNSAIARSPGSTGSTAGNIGLGFAIPSNQARRTAEQLIRTGKAEHPIIGVALDSTYTGRGVKVTEDPGAGGTAPVTKGGPAEKAGIKAGDVILKIDGRPVTEPDELIVAIRAQTPGQTITLTVLRGKSQSEVRVKLSASTD